jgi:arsenite/tail-anchored protein-transporting ATPase
LLIDTSARFVFLAGKGGVGKSTAACALALQLADAGRPTRLFSTDPAHSLKDVLGGENCSDLLAIEEFDANAFAENWLEEARSVLTDLIERGTYLDASDAGSFLDLSLPGVDEVMAAFRLVELEKTSAERIVVDTAPTGHTLRLLAAADVIESWTYALEAMADKAEAVAFALVGAAPTASARGLIRDWRETGTRFHALLRDAEFILITRPGDVVAAETEDLRAALQQRALRITAVISNTAPASGADGFIPLLSAEPVGCAALRSLRILDSTAAAADAHAYTTTVHAGQTHGSIIDEIPGRLRLIAGKGGVGKSTCAAALALASAGRLETCLISTDPAGSLGDVLQADVSSSAARIAPKLRVWQVDADSALAHVRSSYEEDVRQVFQQLGIDQTVALDRAVVERFWNLAPPGLDEIVALTELTAATESCETVVLDSAPTGHFLRLIAMPQIAVDWAHALLRLLLKYRIAGSLEGFSQNVLSFARRTRDLQARLTAPEETAAVLVTLDEPVVWAETERLHRALEAAKIPVAALIINRTDGGPLRGHPVLRPIPRVIRAPLLPEPPIGLTGLREFLGRWELLS